MLNCLLKLFSSNFHLIRSKNLLTNDFQLTVSNMSHKFPIQKNWLFLKGGAVVALTSSSPLPTSTPTPTPSFCAEGKINSTSLSPEPKNFSQQNASMGDDHHQGSEQYLHPGVSVNRGKSTRNQQEIMNKVWFQASLWWLLKTKKNNISLVIENGKFLHNAYFHASFSFIARSHCRYFERIDNGLVKLINRIQWDQFSVSSLSDGKYLVWTGHYYIIILYFISEDFSTFLYHGLVHIGLFLFKRSLLVIINIVILWQMTHLWREMHI